MDVGGTNQLLIGYSAICQILEKKKWDNTSAIHRFQESWEGCILQYSNGFLVPMNLIRPSKMCFN